MRFIAKQNSLMKIGNNGNLVLGPFDESVQVSVCGASKSRETILNFTSKLNSNDGSKKRKTTREVNDVVLDRALETATEWYEQQSAVLLNYYCSRESETFQQKNEGVQWTATAGSDVVQSGRPIFDNFFQHLRPYIGNNTANVVFQMVERLWLIRIDQCFYISPQKIV
ncbi:hypothetical protein TNCV_4206041 [Trichonephila clavipes]|nr:hypothetical protein TNCV_4206041 [Trichonephila clavipes]